MKYSALLVIFALLAIFQGCAKPIEIERSSEFHKQEGEAYFRDGKYSKAVVSYEEALMRAESPEEAAKIQLAMGDSFYMMREYADAIPVYEVYLDVYNNSPEAAMVYYRTGMAYYNLKNRIPKDQTPIIKAREYLEKAVALDPSMLVNHGIDGIFRDIRERLAEKEYKIARYYWRILQKEPAILRYEYICKEYTDTKIYPLAAYRLVVMLIDEGKIDDAENYLTVLKLKFPENKYTKDAQEKINSATPKGR